MIDRGTLYKAYSAAYRKERNRQAIVQSVDIAFVIVGLYAAVRDWKWPHLSAVALLWLVFREAPWFLRPDSHRRTAVKIQERFDCSLGIPPNEVTTGKPVPDHEVFALANTSSEAFAPGYFVDVSGLPPEVAVVVLQHQTATWAEVGHRRYSVFNYIVAFATIVTLAIWAYLTTRTMQESVTQLFSPAAPFVVGRLQLGRRHHEQSRTRAEIREHAEDAFARVTSDSATHPTLIFTRSLQDRLYYGRLNEGRIPGWLYHLLAARDRLAIDASCQQRADHLKTLVRA